MTRTGYIYRVQTDRFGNALLDQSFPILDAVKYWLEFKEAETCESHAK